MTYSNISGKKVLCFGVSPGYQRQKFLQGLVEGGVDLTIARLPEERFYIDFPFSTHEFREEELEETLSALKGITFDCGLTYDEMFVHSLSNSALHLNYKNQPLDRKTADVCRDKRLMKQRFKRDGVPSADFRLWESKDDLTKYLVEMSLTDKDYILKPGLGASSAGVYHAHAGTSVEEVYTKFMELLQSGAENPRYREILDAPFLVEKYLSRFGEPVELAVEGWVEEGQIKINLVSEKVDMVTTGPFKENKYLAPPMSDFVLRDMEEIKDITLRAVRSLGIDNSGYHLELRYDDNELNVLELAHRVVGGLVSESSQIITGVDLRLQHLLLSLGEPAIESRDTSLATCLGTMYNTPEYDLKNIGEAQELLQREGFIYELQPSLGKSLSELKDWLVSFIVSSSDSGKAYSKFYQNLAALDEIMKK